MLGFLDVYGYQSQYKKLYSLDDCIDCIILASNSFSLSLFKSSQVNQGACDTFEEHIRDFFREEGLLP